MKKKYTETCYLIRENETNDKIEYFDFNLMKFTGSCDKSVPFSTIDAMTTCLMMKMTLNVILTRRMKIMNFITIILWLKMAKMEILSFMGLYGMILS